MKNKFAAILCVLVFAPIILPAEETLPVSVMNCPKCRCRIRLAPDGRSASVNIARLADDLPDEPTLKLRTERAVARARALLAEGRGPSRVKRPLMGWSTWNTFGTEISEPLILETARALATNGLGAAGYVYVNIDDGFFDGHDANGRLKFHPRRFPNGLKRTVDGIHALGLKAGIYSDAGRSCCGGSPDSGLYGHDESDLHLHFNELGFDFIKVDYCGGSALKLDERLRYTEISRVLRSTGREDARLNICRWAFPGTWAADVAESWRTTCDIRASWKLIRQIVDESLYLSAYASPGHYNDMDMLETGRLAADARFRPTFDGDTGLTREEEQTHFGLWCLLSSPLILGCDVRNMDPDSLKLVTNRSLLAMNQNDLGLQAYVAARDGEAYVLVKDALERFGRSRYVALYNAGDAVHEFKVTPESVDLSGEVDVLDLVEQGDVGSFTNIFTLSVPPHGTRFFRFDAERRTDRTFYEAETAYLTAYQELVKTDRSGTAYPAQWRLASGGVAVCQLGMKADNDLVWKEVCISRPGEYCLEFAVMSPDKRCFFVQIDDDKPVELFVPATGGVFVNVSCRKALSVGIHYVRIFNAVAQMPIVDSMRLVPSMRVE